MHRISISIAILLVISTSQALPSARPNTADKAAIIQWATNTLVDPYSLRSTAISEVVEVKGIPVVCIEFNARNQYGGYEGIQRTAFVFRAGTLVHGSLRGSGTDTGTCYAPGVVMRPFPELSSIR